jgi:hypothetical protein
MEQAMANGQEDGAQERAREKFPVADWRYEVANGDTVLGYEEWLLHQLEAER